MHWVAVALGSDASISMCVENAEAATQLKPAPSGQKPLQVLTASATAWGMQLTQLNCADTSGWAQRQVIQDSP